MQPIESIQRYAEFWVVYKTQKWCNCAFIHQKLQNIPFLLKHHLSSACIVRFCCCACFNLTSKCQRVKFSLLMTSCPLQTVCRAPAVGHVDMHCRGGRCTVSQTLIILGVSSRCSWYQCLFYPVMIYLCSYI